MGVVDRNVLRMALYELMHCEDIPPVVTINEAVDLAKFFSNTESGRFVNGVLDRVRKDLKREARAGTKESPDGV
jgi:N utilization substance protein B